VKQVFLRICESRDFLKVYHVVSYCKHKTVTNVLTLCKDYFSNLLKPNSYAKITTICLNSTIMLKNNYYTCCT